jgi:prophage regulatory protein
MTHHLLGIAELAQLLGVSRQRAVQIADSYDDFPAPVVELAAGRVWLGEDVERWIKRHPDRRPGRGRQP